MKTKIYLTKFKYFLLFLLFITTNIVFAQDPSWLKDSWRSSQYPENVFLKGFAQDSKNKNETVAEATERVKNMARANLSETILATVKSVSDSYSESIMQGDNEVVNESFKSQIQVSTNLELNGVSVESYVKDNMIYGFAHANKYEIIGYYKANLNMQVQQIEGLISTAKELENNHEKKKAKDEFNKALPIFNEIAEAQGILTALDKNISEADLKKEKTMGLYNEVIQANARLAQAIMVYIDSNEDNFGQSTNLIENGLKAILAENECSFTTNELEADWKIRVKATSREFNFSNDVYFSYVDAQVELYKAPSEKHVYQNEFSQKGAHSKSYKEAARKALDDISKQISEKLLNWINN